MDKELPLFDIASIDRKPSGSFAPGRPSNPALPLSFAGSVELHAHSLCIAEPSTPRKFVRNPNCCVTGKPEVMPPCWQIALDKRASVYKFYDTWTYSRLTGQVSRKGFVLPHRSTPTHPSTPVGTSPLFSYWQFHRPDRSHIWSARLCQKVEARFWHIIWGCRFGCTMPTAWELKMEIPVKTDHRQGSRKPAPTCTLVRLKPVRNAK